MQAQIRSRILEVSQASAIASVEPIQALWNGYGMLARVHLADALYPSVILKHVQIPKDAAHPRGFTGDIGRARKVRSYDVEVHWYLHLNREVSTTAATPSCLAVVEECGEVALILEDLCVAGFPEARWSVSTEEVEVVLRWLARFHARFIGEAGEGLWPTGTYWHLETRPEELERIRGTRLHQWAGFLDARLSADPYLTLVHGDAKLANYCFSEDGAFVAAVDFQYVGRGCAMKDVAYFLGSCLSGDDCEVLESRLLNSYFQELRGSLPAHLDGSALESEWRELFPVAWADFERFMLGWSPGHKKLTGYSHQTTEMAMDQVEAELMDAAREACLAAGRHIESSRRVKPAVRSKGFASEAADVVTEVDEQAQAIIASILAPTLARYDLGMLAEEGEHDDSRHKKHAFWAVDPLDGTQRYIHGDAGYATSVALVSRAGRPLLGVVYDPAGDALYEAVKGRGVTCNGAPLVPPRKDAVPSRPSRLFADPSLRQHPGFESLQERFEVCFVGGAVMNAIHVLTVPNSVYLKFPKPDLGGCAIWDLAAVSLMLEEVSGTVRTAHGEALSLNREQSVYFNDVGLVMASADLDADTLLTRLSVNAPMAV